jgi:hypothetical protein
VAEEFKRQMAAREAATVQRPAVQEPAPSEEPIAPEKPVEKPAPAARIGLTELREGTIRSLSQVRGILASGLEKSLPWRWEGETRETLVIPMRDALTAQLLKNDASLIRQVLADLRGSPLRFEVAVEAGDAPPEEEELAPQAALVLRMFRGTVVKQSSMETSNEYQSL